MKRESFALCLTLLPDFMTTETDPRSLSTFSCVKKRENTRTRVQEEDQTPIIFYPQTGSSYPDTAPPAVSQYSLCSTCFCITNSQMGKRDRVATCLQADGQEPVVPLPPGTRLSEDRPIKKVSSGILLCCTTNGMIARLNGNPGDDCWFLLPEASVTGTDT